jgi:lambda family phage portal protein
MKLFNFNITRDKPLSTDPESWRAALRPDVTQGEIDRANNQIRRFARLHEQMRSLFDSNDRMQRSYDGAVSTQFNADLKGTFGSANAEIMTSDYSTRARSRTIAKDTPQGKAIIRTFQNNVVGDDPFKLDMRYGSWTKKKDPKTGQTTRQFVEEEEINTAIETEWQIFGQPENFTVKMNMSRMEAERIMEASAVRDGFILLRHQRGFPRNPYRYATELLECDRLQSAYMGKSDSGNPIRFSIEYDKRWNCPVAYWILTRHPGDIFGQSTMAGTLAYGNGMGAPGSQEQLFRERIPAEDIVMFNNLRDRAEQDIGFTELDASVQSLWRLFQYEKALTYAAIASCMKPFWIKKNFPTGMQFTTDEIENFLNRVNTGVAGGAGAAADGAPGNSGTTARQQQIAQRVSADVPGSTIDLPYGLELMQTDPKFPIEAAHDFRQDNQRDIAVATGTSYQDVSGDFQNLGFAAALMCQTPKQDYCKIRQHNFIDCAVRPVFREWLRATILSTRFDEKYPGLNISITKLEDYVQAAKFKGKRWAFVNPLVQAQTLIIMMEAEIISPQQVQDQLPDGVSIETLYTLIAEAKSEHEKHGLDIENMDVTRPTISKGEPGELTPAQPGLEEGAPAQPTPTTKPANPVRKLSRNLDTSDSLLYIVRHGETQLNADGMTRGWANPPLNDAGRVEAAAAADKLADRGITMVVSSDLLRAVETAVIIGRTINAQVVVDPGLRPWGFGPEIEGKSSVAVAPQIEHYARNPDERPTGKYPDGTLPETFNQYRERIFQTIEKIQNTYPSGQTAIVTHYRTFKALESRTEGHDVDVDTFIARAPDNPGSVYVLDNGALSENLPVIEKPVRSRSKPRGISKQTMALIAGQGDGK